MEPPMIGRVSSDSIFVSWIPFDDKTLPGVEYVLQQCDSVSAAQQVREIYKGPKLFLRFYIGFLFDSVRIEQLRVGTVFRVQCRSQLLITEWSNWSLPIRPPSARSSSRVPFDISDVPNALIQPPELHVVSSSRVSLQWLPSERLNSSPTHSHLLSHHVSLLYVVEMASSNGSFFEVYVTPSTSCTLDDISPGSLFKFRVYVCSPNGRSVPTPEVCVSIPPCFCLLYAK
jgi:hypothetical protein